VWAKHRAAGTISDRQTGWSTALCKACRSTAAPRHEWALETSQAHCASVLQARLPRHPQRL